VLNWLIIWSEEVGAVSEKILEVCPEFISKCRNVKHSVRLFTGKPPVPSSGLLTLD
jgi:hypothetical protein